jgi:hypothetical protein
MKNKEYLTERMKELFLHISTLTFSGTFSSNYFLLKNLHLLICLLYAKFREKGFIFIYLFIFLNK